MPTYQSTPGFEHGQSVATGVLLVNLGTPDSADSGAVRRFLKPFLWDRRVVEYPRWLWWLILNLAILRIRPARSARAYKKIWRADGSPLRVYCDALTEAIQNKLSNDNSQRFVVGLAMSYSEPSIDNAIDELLRRGARRLLVLPMYPQYSATTTASVIDAVARKFAALRWIPESRFINDYHSEPGYIAALANRVREAWQENGRSKKLLMSFHGVPKNTLLRGDPYHCQCRHTGRLLAEALQLDEDDWILSFQSRVGREEWLSPYTDETLQQLGQQGLESIDVICPGFSVDCLETLEEIEMQNAETFTANGGGELRYVPALNAHAEHVDFLESLIRKHSAGWEQRVPEQAGSATKARALAMGADR